MTTQDRADNSNDAGHEPPIERHSFEDYRETRRLEATDHHREATHEQALERYARILRKD